MAKIPRNLKHYLENIVKETLKTAFNIDTEVIFEETPKPEFGDYSSNFLFRLKKELPQPIQTVGDIITLEVLKKLQHIADEVSTQTGFLNIKLSNKTLHNILLEINNNPDEYGKTNVGDGKYINLEFVSANPTGPLNIVSARAASIGDSLKRIMNYAGYKAESEFYSNNAGQQVKHLVDSVKWWIKKLQGINEVFPPDGYRGEYLKDIAKMVMEKGIEEEKLPKFITDTILNEQLETLKAFDVHYDHVTGEDFIRESKFPGLVLRVLKDEKFLFFEDGATFFRSTDFGDTEPRVIIRRDGTGTYFFYDLAYHLYKLHRGYDELIDILGPDHHGYIKRMEAGLSALGYPGKLKIIIAQQVSLLKNGEKIKMSKRRGEYYTLRELLREVKKDAARFFFLMRTRDAHLDFDIDLAKKIGKENPVYYVQYMHARSNSLLKHGREHSIIPKCNNLRLLRLPEERLLMRRLMYFPDTVERAAQRMEPHEIPRYLIKLADIFHNYYQKNRIIDPKKPELSGARLYLVLAVKNVVKKALYLIGVNAPEEM